MEQPGLAAARVMADKVVELRRAGELPIATPSNYTLTFGGRSYRLSVDNPRQ